MPPHWLVVVSWTALSIAFACALAILADVYLRGHRQQMGVMEAVWPVTALYAGPVALWGYWRFGRPMSARWMREHGTDEPPSKPGWATFFPDPHLQPDSPVYWFLMAIGMCVGFATSWPANVWLIRRGIKEAM